MSNRMTVGIDKGTVDGDHSAVVFAAPVSGGGRVILDTLTAEPADAFIALLRVARAAKDCTLATYEGDLMDALDVLEEALKELPEGLLD